VDDGDVTSCFLLFHDISESPRKIHNPVVDFQSLGLSFQFASQYARKSKDDVKKSKETETECPEDT